MILLTIAVRPAKRIGARRMNEQILKLYKQAQEFAYKNISKESWNTDNFHAVVSGKFAELIIKECCSQVREIDAMEINKHFGVEE